MVFDTVLLHVLDMNTENWLVRAIQAEPLRMKTRIRDWFPAFLCPEILHGAAVAPHVAYGTVPTAMYEAPRYCIVGFALFDICLAIRDHLNPLAPARLDKY